MRSMEISVSPATSWSELEAIWSESMKHLYWYSSATPADYHPVREINELKEEFDSGSNEFLVARNAGGTALGVLTYSVSSNFARNGIMMPGVPVQDRGMNVGSILLEHQEASLREVGINTVFSSVKYKERSSVDWYFDTLKANGFVEKGPEVCQLLVRLADVSSQLKSSESIEFRTRDEFSAEEFVDFTIRAYATTSEDQAIHSYDRAVTVPEHIRDIHQRTIDGGFGRSPPEWWHVAINDSTAVGYILGFEMSPSQTPRLGTIGNLGVFPEFRRKGFSVNLIHSLFEEFLSDGIEYAMVGTPTNNLPAINAYKKAGFQNANRIQFFKKSF
jgi:ribosomal protein S18 acetylase RimI-like enzyme